MATTLETGSQEAVEHLLRPPERYGEVITASSKDSGRTATEVADGSSLILSQAHREEVGIRDLDAICAACYVQKQHLIQEDDKFIVIVPL